MYLHKFFFFVQYFGWFWNHNNTIHDFEFDNQKKVLADTAGHILDWLG